MSHRQAGHFESKSEPSNFYKFLQKTILAGKEKKQDTSLLELMQKNAESIMASVLKETNDPSKKDLLFFSQMLFAVVDKLAFEMEAEPNPRSLISKIDSSILLYSVIDNHLTKLKSDANEVQELRNTIKDALKDAVDTKKTVQEQMNTSGAGVERPHR